MHVVNIAKHSESVDIGIAIFFSNWYCHWYC